MRLINTIRIVACIAVFNMPLSLSAENLYQGNQWAFISGDQKASKPGDILTVIVAESIESRNSERNIRNKDRNLNAGIRTSGLSEFGDVSVGSGVENRGEMRRSESLVTSISVVITQKLPSGNYLVSGQQHMNVNGERTIIEIRGQIRPQDISADNVILSSRVLNAEINYDGEGYVSKGRKNSVIDWLFGVFGLV